MTTTKSSVAVTGRGSAGSGRGKAQQGTEQQQGNAPHDPAEFVVESRVKVWHLGGTDRLRSGNWSGIVANQDGTQEFEPKAVSGAGADFGKSGWRGEIR